MIRVEVENKMVVKRKFHSVKIMNARNVIRIKVKDKMVVSRTLHTAKIMNALNATPTPWATLSVLSLIHI